MFEFGMDLGTSSVLLYRQGKGIVLREPSVVAVRRRSGQVVSVGQTARDMLGRTPEDLLAVRPVRGGVITDCEIAGIMARTMLKRAGCGGVFRPNLLICVPPLVSELEERAVIDAGMQAGASRVYLMEQPVAAAAGAGIDPHSPKGTLVVDIGGGTTDIAVISMGAVVRAASIRIAGDSCDNAVQAYLREAHDLYIGLSTAEYIKCEIGGVLPREEEKQLTVRGRRVSDGLPACMTVTSGELIPILCEQAEQILAAICELIEITPPELVGDLTETGLVLAGGGSRLYGIDSYLSQGLGLETHCSDDPEACVIQGTSRVLGRLKNRKEGTINIARRRQGII
ncbi:rod shape-determining protein [Butyricicoccus sp.]|uniref:rod shape-determining protein n=1 Tax=Butyricicoccus sp. TaxID=2049021 RepID=UPI003F15ECAF